MQKLISTFVKMESKKIWQARIKLCKKILSNLVGEGGEFAELGRSKKIHFLIYKGSERDWTRGIAGRASFTLPLLGREYAHLTKNHSLIMIPSTAFRHWPDLDPVFDLTPILCHELTHILTQRNDDDPIFIAECKKRNVPLHFSKTDLDLSKRISSAIIQALLQKIRSGELKIHDSDGDKIVEVFHDAEEPETLFEWMEFIDNEVKRQLPEAVTKTMVELVEEWQEKEIEKILEET